MQHPLDQASGGMACGGSGGGPARSCWLWPRGAGRRGDGRAGMHDGDNTLETPCPPPPHLGDVTRRSHRLAGKSSLAGATGEVAFPAWGARNTSMTVQMQARKVSPVKASRT